MVRVRYAPSPTGFLHLGGLRTALYNFLFARHEGGKFLLRIEDTDQARLVPGATESLLNTLHLFDLDSDERPVVQSERLSIYKKYADELVTAGYAYRDGDAIRLRVPKEGSTGFDDIIHGTTSFENKSIDESVLLKSDGYPTYHLANVVDDHEMKITHVIRGDEWIPSTPKHILLYRAFGWEPPQFAHLPLILNPDRSKLSKRQGDVAVEDYLKKGYIPEALINFVALLGWNPRADQEVYSLDELIAGFDHKKINKSGAVANFEKLDWLNREHLRRLPVEEVVRRASAWVPSFEGITKAIPSELERIHRLDELPDAVAFYLTDDLAYDPKLLIWKKSDAATARARLQRMEKFFIMYSGPFDAHALEEALKTLIADEKLGAGETFWPLRVALSGRAASPSPFEIAAVLGKEKTLARINKAYEQLGAQI